MDHSVKLSSTDRKLLRLIQSRGGRSKQELADAAGMSASTLWRRLNELDGAGLIKGQVTLLDPERVGLPVCAIVSVNLTDHETPTRDSFENFVADCEYIMECYLVTGEFDYMLIARCESVQDFELLLMRRILTHKSVASTSSQIALAQKKYTTMLPI